MSRAYIVLLLILLIPASAHALKESESLSSENGSDYCLLFGADLEGGLWDSDLELLCLDMDALYDLLLESCLELEITDEEIYEILPDLWELDYEPYLFWEDNWYY